MVLISFQFDVKTLPSYRTVSQLKQEVVTQDPGSTASGEYWQFEKKEFNDDQVL